MGGKKSSKLGENKNSCYHSGLREFQRIRMYPDKRRCPLSGVAVQIMQGYVTRSRRGTAAFILPHGHGYYTKSLLGV